VRIGRRTAAEALAAVRPLVHRDNEMGFQLLAPTLLVVPEVLYACGIATEAATVRVELEAADGTPFTLQLEALPPGAVAWRKLGPTAGEPPLRWRHPGTSYWFEILPEPRALYVHIDKIENRPDESYAAFAARLAETAGAQRLERLVLDLRDCAGGDGSLNRGLVLALLQLEMQARPVQIHALIGRGTFSAAVMLASDLERWTHAVFVGEPTGGSPSGYGDSRRMQLPHSGLTVRASTIYWRDWTPIEARPALEPELAVPYTAADARAGRDPVLEAALRHAPEADLAGRLRGLLERGASLPAELVYYRYKTDPRTSRIDTEALMNGLGAALCAAGRLSEAQHVYGLNLQDYPGSAAAHAGLGQVHAAAGRTQAAQESLTNSLEIDPHNPEAAALLERLRKPGG
jgi:tetratricopeptide (TPR) repeat protein